MFAEVPVLPVVVPLGGVVLALLLWHLRRTRLLSVRRGAVAVALSVYVAGIVANTIFPIFLDKPTSDIGWDAFVNVTPLVEYEAHDALMNTAVFIPLGVLLALAMPDRGWWRALGAATALSLGIEVSQYLTAQLLGGGHVADVNDFLFNVVGAAAGLGVLLVAARVPAVGRFVDRFRWTHDRARPAPRATHARS